MRHDDSAVKVANDLMFHVEDLMTKLAVVEEEREQLKARLSEAERVLEELHRWAKVCQIHNFQNECYDAIKAYEAYKAGGTK